MRKMLTLLFLFVLLSAAGASFSDGHTYAKDPGDPGMGSVHPDKDPGDPGMG
ncbi:hypothetical protein QRD89_01875 [Halobacillus sp. ACCC02827]|uniref:hypothetical protein n=1 Tax=Bacillaceae TaxID=186817 RepID=UPI00030537C7|nr:MULTISPECIES: hypothetical protein [Bacillaceae]QHT45352.1 hypothetical protein M662_01990 [Bacillus sp. SB49]WJE16137.1 hypothetical protein QRD89_01875 [Halobacillus sp. ACCC02827]